MTFRGVRIVLTAVLAAASVATVLAHMQATKMEPAENSTLTAAPTKVQVWFTEEPDPAVSKLELTGPAGAVTLSGFQIAANNSMTARIEGKLGNGRYTVRWQSAGDDGHLQKDEFAFTVQSTR